MHEKDGNSLALETWPSTRASRSTKALAVLQKIPFPPANPLPPESSFPPKGFVAKNMTFPSESSCLGTWLLKNKDKNQPSTRKSPSTTSCPPETSLPPASSLFTTRVPTHQKHAWLHRIGVCQMTTLGLCGVRFYLTIVSDLLLLCTCYLKHELYCQRLFQ